MGNNDTRNENIRKLLVRLELWFAPLLVIVPMIVSVWFFWDWFTRGFSQGVSAYNGELFIGVFLLVGNLVFDIPFLLSLRSLQKKKQQTKK